MDSLIVQEKLESLRRCVARIELRRAASVAALMADPDTQDIIVLNLTRAIQLCIDIGTHIISHSESDTPRSMTEVFDALANLAKISQSTAAAMRKAVGFRNIAVHNYGELNWEIVQTISRDRVKDFQQFAREVAKDLP